MAFILSNLLSSLDSSIGLLDSSSDLLEVLQALNVTNSTKGYGKSQKRTYDTVASLPTATSALRGSFATVETVGNWEASGNTDNGLYVCNGSDWTLIQGLDSAETPPPFQGSNFGYTSGGTGYAPGTYDIIDKFPFAADFTGTATDVGDLTVNRQGAAGQSSTSHGYTSGGRVSPSYSVVIDKFPFSSDANATDVGDITSARTFLTGQSSIVNGFGYTSGGHNSTGGNVIDKFPFSTDANATDVGDLTVARQAPSGQSSNTSGYASGGKEVTPFPGVLNVIDKFPFSTDANATDVGDLTSTIFRTTGQSSTTHGYSSGGTTHPDGLYTGSADIIDKFPFAADANATDVGDLTVARYFSAGQSSTVSGYTTGGYGTAGLHDVIDKFSFSSDANATDAGDLSVGRFIHTGQQY